MVGERGFEPPTPGSGKRELGCRSERFQSLALVLQPSHSCSECLFRTFISRHCSSKMFLPCICVREKEVSFAGELTRRSRSFQEHLHEHPRVGASSIAEDIALHHYSALLHCLWMSQTRPGTRNYNLSECVVVA